jgi:solute carrier family 25 aspartate/glutamate transporter 12/13
LFGNLKKWAADENGHLTLGPLFGCGTVAGVFSAGLVTPADVVKTRLQTQKPGQQQYSGIVDCFSKILKGNILIQYNLTIF